MTATLYWIQQVSFMLIYTGFTNSLKSMVTVRSKCINVWWYMSTPFPSNNEHLFLQRLSVYPFGKGSLLSIHLPMLHLHISNQACIAFVYSFKNVKSIMKWPLFNRTYSLNIFCWRKQYYDWNFLEVCFSIQFTIRFVVILHVPFKWKGRFTDETRRFILHKSRF